jgi:hypothetical protein
VIGDAAVADAAGVGARRRAEARVVDVVADRARPRAGVGVVEVRAVERAVEVGVVVGEEGLRRDGALARLVDGVEEQVALGDARVVRPVFVELLQRVVVVARAEIERDRDARREVDEVDGVVGEVVVVALVARRTLARSSAVPS